MIYNYNMAYGQVAPTRENSMMHAQPQTLFEALFVSEIEFAVLAVPNKGFAVAVGDQHHGPHEAGIVAASEEIGPWLDAKARELFPASDFAKSVQRDFTVHGMIAEAVQQVPPPDLGSLVLPR